MAKHKVMRVECCVCNKLMETVEVPEYEWHEVRISSSYCKKHYDEAMAELEDENIKQGIV